MSKYMILGGAGVFAVHAVKWLLNLPETTKVIAVGRNIERGPVYQLDVGKNNPKYSYKQIHITFELNTLIELIDKEKPDYIINYAAIAYATSWEKAHCYYETNTLAVVKLCEELAKRDFLKKFVQISTSELYGPVDKPANEEHPLNPTSPYAVSKLAADMHLMTLHLAQKFPMNIIRPSNAYGPGQQIWRIIPRAVFCGLQGQKLPLQGGGTVKKSYIHAYDLAEATYLITKYGRTGEIYNVGSEKPISIREIVELIAEELNISFDKLCHVTPGREFEDAQYWLDSSKIYNELGWQPKISLREGIREIVNWGKEHLDYLSYESQEFELHA